MKTGKLTSGVCIVLMSGWVIAQNAAPPPTELKRANLVTSEAMEVITATMETKPGEEISRHTHHGIETGYVLQGAMIQVPGKDPMPFPTGASFIFERDVPHGGFKVVGDTPLKLLVVFAVDKGKPLTEAAKQ